MASWKKRGRRRAALLCLVTFSWAAGCWPGARDEDLARPTAERSPAASVTLSVAVGDDPQLRAAIGQLAGEWGEVSGGRFEMQDLRSGAPPADLIIFAPALLGELCDRDALRPVRESVLRSPDLAVDDFYPVVRDHLMSIGGQTMALPLGCVTPIVVTRSDADAAWGQVARSGPLRPAWGLLARAAPLAVHELRDSVLFDPESMAPKIAGEPFVEALKRLVASPADEDAAAEIILPNRSGGETSSDAVWSHAQPLPGVGRFFHPVRGEWMTVTGAPRRASLVGVDGRLIAVTAASRNAAAAFKLAGWLAGKANARQLATASPHVANVRRSLARQPDNWLGQGGAGLGREIAVAAEATWQNDLRLVLPRLIGVERYLAVLDEAVESAVSGQASAEEALQEAASGWDALTDEVGRDRQRRCYLRHLGVEQYTPAKR